MGSCLSADSASSFGSCLISLMIGSAALSSSFLSAFVSAGLDVGWELLVLDCGRESAKKNQYSKKLLQISLNTVSLNLNQI